MARISGAQKKLFQRAIEIRGETLPNPRPNLAKSAAKA